MSRKVCVVVTARPSYAGSRRRSGRSRRTPTSSCSSWSAASALLDRYGSAGRHIEDDGFDVAARVYMVVEGENLVTSAKTTGLGLVELATVFDNLQPGRRRHGRRPLRDAGDRRRGRVHEHPVAHVQGGEVTGSIDEKVRHAVTKLADLHFVANERAAERVTPHGRGPGHRVRHRLPVDRSRRRTAAAGPTLDFDPFERYGGVGEQLDLTGGYLVVLQHPVTTRGRTRAAR